MSTFKKSALILLSLLLGVVAASFTGCGGAKVQVGDWVCEIQPAEEAEKPEPVPEIAESVDNRDSALWTVFGPIISDHTNNPNR